MRFHLVHRTVGRETESSQPFYSKTAALVSLLRAAERLPAGDRLFVNDGTIPEPRASLIAEAGEVTQAYALGNARSYRACLAQLDVRTWHDDDLVYFAEDDYLYTDDAFEHLTQAVGAIPEAAYFTLYDHPDYYTDPRHHRFMRRHALTRDVGPIRWREVRSTCLTFAARVGALRADSWVHALCSRADPPLDFAIWSIVEGSGFAVPRLLKPSPDPRARRLLRRHAVRLVLGDQRRPLYAAVPGVATHMSEGLLGPGQDWAAIAAAAANP